MKPKYKVTVEYLIQDKLMSHAVYEGPHRNHAIRAYDKLNVLLSHGILQNAVVTFISDGRYLRKGELK